MQMTMPADQPVVTFLSWDTEGGPRVERNLLRPGKGVTVAVRVAGQWQSAAALPTRIEHPEPNCTQVVLPLAADAELVWELRASAESLTFDFRLAGMHREAVEEIEVRFPFDPGVTPTTVVPFRWDDNGKLALPAIVSAPDFGQMRLTASPTDGVSGRLEGSRTDKIVDLIVTIPAACLQPACRLELTPYFLPVPTGLSDTAMWEQTRRGWWSIWQPSAQWGDQNRPFSAPPGILANNVISDPASCSLWFYADQAFWTPQVAPDIAISALVRRSIDFWLLLRTRPTGEVVCYWDYGNFLDANAGPLIAAWDYVESTGDKTWLVGRIDRLELIASFLASRDVDGDGMVEAVQSGNLGTLQQPNRSCAWFDALNCGHKDGYTNALIYRAWRCLADLEEKLGRSEQASHYCQLADRLQAAYAPTLLNPKTGWLAWWKSADGELHDYATPIVNGLAIEYGLVKPDQGREILDRLWRKIDEVGFSRFDLGVPPMLIPVRRGDYLLPDALGLPQKEDGTDTFGHYQNGGITAGQVLHFLAAHYVVGQPERADRVLRAMLERQARGEFQNGVRDAGYQGVDWTDWQGRPTGYEGYLADSFRFLQACLLREAAFRERFYRPLYPGAAEESTNGNATRVTYGSLRIVTVWYVEEMGSETNFGVDLHAAGWTEQMNEDYASDLADAQKAWPDMARQIDAQLTTKRVRSLSRWAQTQMESYQLPEKAAEHATLVPRAFDPDQNTLIFEATLDTLPTHHSLVTRWLKAFATFDRSQKKFTQVVVTIRGERLE